MRKNMFNKCLKITENDVFRLRDLKENEKNI